MKNIVIVVFDCLRADFCFPEAPPFVEKLKKNGEQYTQFISVATSTVPCFASMLTGLYPESHGIPGHPNSRTQITDDSWSLKKGVVTLPMILKAYGYNTYAEVSDPLVKPFRLDRGFDQYNVRQQDTSIFDDKFFDYMKNLVDDLKTPFFLLLHLFELHSGCRLDKFQKQCLKLEEIFQNMDNIIFIVTGDHGERFKPEDKAVHGRHIFDYLIRVPLVISGEGIVKRIIIEQYSQVDLMPLILNRVGVRYKLPYEIPGRIAPREYAYSRSVGAPLPEHGWLAGIRTERYKYIIHERNKHALALYCLPDEKNNLPIDKNEALVEKLRGKLLDIMRHAEQIDLGDRDMWTDEDEKIVLDRMRRLGYIT